MATGGLLLGSKSSFVNVSFWKYEVICANCSFEVNQSFPSEVIESGSQELGEPRIVRGAIFTVHSS